MSYFDAQPKSKAAAAAEMLDVPEDEGIAKMGLLSPQVTRILDDMDENSDSESDDQASLSGDSSPSDKDAKSDRKSRRDQPNKDHSTNTIRKAQTSPLPHGSKRVQVAQPPPRPGLGGQKHPHMARFHSLRSMLFSSRIEDNMAKQKEKQEQEDSESKWKQQHESRRALNRPKTPEKDEQKPGFRAKVSSTLRRMTSKEVPTMAKITEDGPAESSASSEDEEERRGRPLSRESDQEIDHSDIEDLRRWVSRRDPPSDGEMRIKKAAKHARDTAKEDSGHESLGHSDVDDLVRWVSRKERPQANTEPPVKVAKSEPIRAEETAHQGYSDASTASDSEGYQPSEPRKESMGEDDVDELVRWISRRDGPKAGPVRDKKATDGNDSDSDVDDEDVAELVRWVTRKDDTSGESEVEADSPKSKASLGVPHPSKTGSKLKTEIPQDGHATESRASITHDDVDDLVKWVSRRDHPEKPKAIESEQKGPAESTASIPHDEPAADSRASLTNDDVNDLVQWVSKKDSGNSEAGDLKERDATAAESNASLPQDEPAMDSTASLTNDDVDDLVRYASRKNPNEKEVEQRDDNILKWKQEEDLKSAEI